ncbi:cathepsin [Brachionus plicatilis]|uniref:Cathepsin n=1 Tax=Brachionus plicatilis TaxID=10195 RepID=A0A3M7RZW4_BRAPC|nr:cathepsin [Brachionus plicatilis]
MLKFEFLLNLWLFSLIFGQEIKKPVKPIKNFLNEDWKMFKNSVQISTQDQLKDLEWRRRFEESYDLINKHNLEYELNPRKVKYKLKMTKFAFMSDEEFVAKKTGLKMSRKSNRRKKGRKPKRQILDPDRPKNYDSRKKYPIAVRDQGDCGGCYAFSAVSSIEYQLAKQNKLTYLSEQNFIDCSTPYGNLGCAGGTMDMAYEYMISNNGLNSLLFYPYTAKEDICKFRDNFVGAKIMGYDYIDNEEQLESAIYKYGAVSCGIDATQETFRFYSEGIYDDPKCSNVFINHAINVVGYTENSFICRNSWGSTWGMNGYFELPKGNNSCGLLNFCVYPII